MQNKSNQETNAAAEIMQEDENNILTFSKACDYGEKLYMGCFKGNGIGVCATVLGEIYLADCSFPVK